MEQISLTHEERQLILARRDVAAAKARQAEEDAFDIDDIKPGMSREDLEKLAKAARAIAAVWK